MRHRVDRGQGTRTPRVFAAALWAMSILLAAGCGPPANSAAEDSPTGSASPPSGAIEVRGAWARIATDPGALYLEIANGSGEDDRLVAISSPAAKAIDLHETFEEHGVLKMRSREEGVELLAGEIVVLAPGGLHAMLMGLDVEPEATTIPISIELLRGDTVEASAEIREAYLP